jgi:hypothetical protein
LIHGYSSTPSQSLEVGCVSLCSAIESLSAWGKAQPIEYDGIGHLDTIGIPTYRTEDGNPTDRLEEVSEDIENFPIKKWEKLKTQMLTVDTGETPPASNP